jgi:hypothetical protein
MYRLTKWQWFWKLDVPSSMIGLVWNMMMSMGGGDGRTFVAADILESKQIFARRARERAPLVRAICVALENTEDGTPRRGPLPDLLRRGFSEDEARQQLRIAIDWGRYGELFDFDSNTGQPALENSRVQPRS